MDGKEQELEAEAADGAVDSGPGKSHQYRERTFDFSRGSLVHACVVVMQLAFASLALSLFATGIMLCMIAGTVRSLLVVQVLIYTAYASLGAMGLIVVMIIALNVIGIEEA